MSDYALAGYQLSQDFSKTHSPEEVKAFQQLEGKYEIYNALDWIKQLEGQQAADTYRGTEASLAQSYKQHEEQTPAADEARPGRRPLIHRRRCRPGPDGYIRRRGGEPGERSGTAAVSGTWRNPGRVRRYGRYGRYGKSS